MTTSAEKKKGSSLLRLLLGLGLLLPPTIACFGSLLLPTLLTFLTSLTRLRDITAIDASQFVGLENFSYLLGDRLFHSALVHTIGLLLVRMLVAALIPPLLAVAVNRSGRGLRLLVRLLATVPLALFAPVSAALAWGAAFDMQKGILNRLVTGLGLDPVAWINTPTSASAALFFLEGLMTAGIACGIGLPLFLAAQRGSGGQTASKTARPMIISWVAGLIAAMALPFPAFETAWVIFKGGPVNATETLGTFLYRSAFIRYNFGMGAAAAVILLGFMLTAGLIVGVILAAGNLRLKTVPPGKPPAATAAEGTPREGKKGTAILPAVMALVVLCLLALGLPPLLQILTTAGSGLSKAFGHGGIQFGTILNTLLPSLLTVLFLQLPLAYLGALGIGAARPLGKRSEWLLLPFAPWLLVTVFPLSIAFFLSLKSVGGLDQWTTLFPPIRISIPALFILTLFFKGQEPQWRAAQAAGKTGAAAFLREMILPSLPLTALLAAAALLVNMQELIWPLISVNRDSLMTIPAFLMMFAGQYGSNLGLVAAANAVLELPIFLVFFAVFALFTILYLDRLAITPGE
ncbi:MAG: hypothetical protein JW929_06465 [Anaerolineales bacterium]|nr:hypothetical protein [Anaerolineales bacterium]